MSHGGSAHDAGLFFFCVCYTGPPSAPQNLIFNINQTTVSLEWSPPADNGGRNDVTYRILCKRCSWEQGECVPCGSNIGYMPQQTGLVDNYVTVMDLLAHANYTFEVEAVNGVSDLSRSQRLFAAVSITTGQAGKFSSFMNLNTKRNWEHINCRCSKSGTCLVCSGSLVFSPCQLVNLSL